MNKPYPPSEDTFLLEDALKDLPEGRMAADIGCSEGYIAKVLAEKGFEVVATDIDQSSIVAARKTLEPYYGKVHLLNASLLPARPNVFDVVVSNPPYLPEDDEFKDTTIHGGPSGVDVAVQLLENAKECIKRGGVIYIIASSLSEVYRRLKYALINGFELVDEVKLRLFFETLYCFKFTLTL